MAIGRRDVLRGGAALLTWSTLPSWARGSAPPRFPEVSASGSAGAIGTTIGRTFADAIARNVGLYGDWLRQAIGIERPRALEVARGFIPVLRDHTPALLEEMDGMAKGSGRPLDEIVMVNARTDMLVMGRRERARTPTTPGCTTMALTGRVDGREHIALGQNWDWRAVFGGNTVLMRIERTGSPRLVTVSEAGMVGKIGFNEDRLGVCLNFLSHPSESPQADYGVPVHVLLRAMMECRSLEEAHQKIGLAPRCASANFLLAQHGATGPRALDLEWTPSAVGKLTLREQTLIHTNHFLEPALAAGNPSKLGTSTTNRLSVATRLAQQLRTNVPDPVERMQRILKDRTGSPYSVSRSPGAESAGQTLAGVVMDLSRNRLFVAAGQPHVVPFLELPGA